MFLQLALLAGCKRCSWKANAINRVMVDTGCQRTCVITDIKGSAFCDKVPLKLSAGDHMSFRVKV